MSEKIYAGTAVTFEDTIWIPATSSTTSPTKADFTGGTAFLRYRYDGGSITESAVDNTLADDGVVRKKITVTAGHLEAQWRGTDVNGDVWFSPWWSEDVEASLPAA